MKVNIIRLISGWSWTWYWKKSLSYSLNWNDYLWHTTRHFAEYRKTQLCYSYFCLWCGCWSLESIYTRKRYWGKMSKPSLLSYAASALHVTDVQYVCAREQFTWTLIGKLWVLLFTRILLNRFFWRLMELLVSIHYRTYLIRL